MDECEIDGETGETNGIYINGINYSYSITKSEKEKDSLIIKLYAPLDKSNIYFTYEGDLLKLKNDIKFLELFENIDKIITCLNDIFNKGNAQVEYIRDHNIYNLKLQLILSGTTKNSIIKLNKHEPKKESYDEFKDKANKSENKYEDLLNKYEELKTIKENEIKKIVKELLFDKDIQFKFLEDLEKLRCPIF